MNCIIKGEVSTFYYFYQQNKESRKFSSLLLGGIFSVFMSIIESKFSDPQIHSNFAALKISKVKVKNYDR